MLNKPSQLESIIFGEFTLLNICCQNRQYYHFHYDNNIEKTVLDRSIIAYDQEHTPATEPAGEDASLHSCCWSRITADRESNR